MSALTKIPDATYYDCSEHAEQLTWETPEEAVSDYLDGWMSLKTTPENVAALIREHSPITIFCYVRKSIDEKWLYWTAGALLENALESYGEDYGDPDEGSPFSADEQKHAETLIQDALRKAFADVEAWQCEQTAKVELSAEDVEAMMRKQNPEWFEAKS